MELNDEVIQQQDEKFNQQVNMLSIVQESEALTAEEQMLVLRAVSIATESPMDTVKDIANDVTAYVKRIVKRIIDFLLALFDMASTKKYKGKTKETEQAAALLQGRIVNFPLGTATVIKNLKYNNYKVSSIAEYERLFDKELGPVIDALSVGHALKKDITIFSAYTSLKKVNVSSAQGVNAMEIKVNDKTKMFGKLTVDEVMDMFDRAYTRQQLIDTSKYLKKLDISKIAEGGKYRLHIFRLITLCIQSDIRFSNGMEASVNKMLREMETA